MPRTELHRKRRLIIWRSIGANANAFAMSNHPFCQLVLPLALARGQRFLDSDEALRSFAAILGLGRVKMETVAAKEEALLESISCKCIRVFVTTLYSYFNSVHGLTSIVENTTHRQVQQSSGGLPDFDYWRIVALPLQTSIRTAFSIIAHHPRMFGDLFNIQSLLHISVQHSLNQVNALIAVGIFQRWQS